MAVNNQQESNPKIEALKAKLRDNPKYDEEWIESASNLIINFNWSEHALDAFNGAQLAQLCKAQVLISDDTDKHYDISYLANPALNSSQLQMAVAAINAKVSMSVIKKFIKPEITYTKAQYGILAAMKNIDISKYIEDGYSTEQIYEIYCATQTGADYTYFARKEYSAEKMGLIRHALEVGFKISIRDSDGIVSIGEKD